MNFPHKVQYIEKLSEHDGIPDLYWMMDNNGNNIIMFLSNSIDFTYIGKIVNYVELNKFFGKQIDLLTLLKGNNECYLIGSWELNDFMVNLCDDVVSNDMLPTKGYMYSGSPCHILSPDD